jgi:predicted MFS family arabinose efflux permease
MGAFCSAVSSRVADAQLPRLAAEFGVSLGAASWVITSFVIAFGVAQLFFGPVGDRYGKYRVVAWGTLACALTASLCGLAPGFSALLAARLLAGATAAAIIPLSMAWIGDMIPYERRQTVLARFLLGQVIGLSAGVALGGFAVDHLGWRVPFFMIALMFLAIGLAMRSLSRRLPPQAPAPADASGNVLRRFAADYGQVLATPWARVVLLAVFVEGGCVFGALGFVASHLHQVHGVSLSRAGGLVMLFGAGGALFATASRPLVRRLGEVGLAAWGGALMFVALGTISLAPSWTWAPPACFLAGLGFYMLHNTLQTNATQMAPARRGAAVSSYASFFFMGQAAGLALAGALVARVGTGAIIAMCAAGALLAGWGFALALLRRRRRDA